MTTLHYTFGSREKTSVLQILLQRTD